MGVAAISHYKYDLDRYVAELNRITILSSTYFIEDPIIRNAYVKDVSDFISNAYSRFRGTFDPNEKMRIVYEVREEKEQAESEYRKFRLGDYVKRVVTEIYEEQGVFKYTTVATDVVSSSITMYGGYSLFKAGSMFHSNKLKILGATLFSHGANSLFETVAPLIVDHQESGPLRRLYRYGAEKLGYNKYTGDFAYSSTELVLSIYSGAYGFQKINNPNSLATIPFVKRMFGHRDTGRLFYYVTKDFARKWSLKPTPMKVIFVGQQLMKAKIELYDGDYKFNEE
jgi:hypothetical protein